MTTSITDTATLHNGVGMPWFGLGVWRTQEGEETVNAVRWALAHGYRHIDTAAIYQNEHGVGEGVARSGVPREEIFVTTKVWNSDQGYDKTLAAFADSLERINMDYVDLYLVHWPKKGTTKDTWRALESLYEQGKARAIGVSNFLEHHLDDLLSSAKVAPMVNQVEFHPYLQQPELVQYCRQHRIQMEAWAPIMKGRVNDIPEIAALGRKYGKTPIQVTLRWELQREIITIPKSVHRERIEANANVFDFVLDEADLAAMDALDKGERVGPHPDEIDF